MGKTPNAVVGATLFLRSRTARAALGRAVVEALDGRALMCVMPAGPQLVGTAVPWASPPMTVPADGPVNEAVPVAGVAADGSRPADPSPRALAGPAPIRIDAGGPGYTDAAGAVWLSDRNYAGGTAATGTYPVANTASDPLYASRRYGAFNYNVPVAAAGTYAVKLHFADPLYTTAGKRKFTVRAEGTAVLSNFDVAASGGGRAALVRSFNVAVSDGTLNLSFAKVLENPIVSAIEVIPPSSNGPVGTVAGLTLVNANTEVAIGPFASGATLDRSGGRAYSVRADVSGNVRSVKFLLDGQPVRIESAAPLAVAGDNNGDYAVWTVPAGSHTLTVVPYSGTGATGTAGTPVSVSFTVAGPNPGGDGFTRLTWANQPSALMGKAEALTAKWGTRLYVLGGFSGSLGPVTDSHYYDTADDSWHRVASLPQRITHAGVTHDGQAAYIVGGYVGTPGKTGYGQTFGSNRVWRYDFAADAYAALPNLPRALAGGGAALLGRELHYVGGYELNRTDTNVHLVLDLDNPSAGWKTAAVIPHARSHMGAVAFGGKLYTLAGQTGNDAGLVTQRWVDVYDPATKLWGPGTAVPQALSHVSSSTFVMGDRILILGGESAHNAPVRSAWAYAPGTGEWTALTPLPAARFSGVANTFGGRLFFTTGNSLGTTWEGTPG